jgi:hypothetical protein
VWKDSGMGETAKRAQRARASGPDARLERGRQRRLALDKDRAAREARIDAAVADVYQAQDERAAAARAMQTADGQAGEAIARILAEGLPIAQVAELTELTVNQVQRLREAAGDTQPASGETPAQAGCQPRRAGEAAVRVVPPLAGDRPQTAVSGPGVGGVSQVAACSPSPSVPDVGCERSAS